MAGRPHPKMIPFTTPSTHVAIDDDLMNLAREFEPFEGYLSEGFERFLVGWPDNHEPARDVDLRDAEVFAYALDEK